MPTPESTYYAPRKQRVSEADLADAYLANALLGVWAENLSVYGMRKLWHEARRSGLEVGRDQVGRRMGILGIRGVLPGDHRTRTTEAAPDGAPRHPDLVKREWHAPSRRDELWVADFERHEAFLDLAVVQGHRSISVSPVSPLSQIEFRVAARKSWLAAMAQPDRAAELRKASVRAKVEHPLLIVKRDFGFTKTRYRGMAKNLSHLNVLFASANQVMRARAVAVMG